MTPQGCESTTAEPSPLYSFPADNAGAHVPANTVGTPSPQWIPARKHYEPPATDLAKEITTSTPSNAELLRWSGLKRNAPPSSWWNDQTDPFETDST
jgi:hypothetical protein